jgi:hypothetical protein
MEMYRLAVKM